MEEIISKIAYLMQWDSNEGETPIEVFERECNDLSAIPDPIVIDVVYVGSLERWAALQIDIGSEAELCKMLENICLKTIVANVFRDRKRREVFPPLYNFFTYCNNLQKSGKLARECEGIANIVWNGELARKRLSIKCKEQYSTEPSELDYNKAVAKMQDIWGLSNKDIDALRYFVCQCKNHNHNPSQNKELYLYGEIKQTGKTTFARAFATVLNADEFNNFGKYESTFSKEMGFNDHDLPLACLYNCVILDEAMPKDSRKSYGGLKSVFTSNSYNYNPKFRQVVNIPARRNYICTSNDDINEFIQDRFERRFYAIHFNKKPKQVSFLTIHSIIKSFCINATPRCSWQEWYNDFEMVTGAAEKDKNEVLQEILASIVFFNNRSTCTAKQVANYIFKNEPTREQKKSVEVALSELADDCRYESNKYVFDCRKVASKIMEYTGADMSTVDNDTDLPF